MLKGILYVGFGAVSYGVLATVVKLAYNQGYSTEEVTFSQFGLGWLMLAFSSVVYYYWSVKKTVKNPLVKNHKSIWQLILAGTSLGFTGLFYYKAVHYVPVSLCIVLLMQSVWMGVLLEALIDKKKPEPKKWISVLFVLLGTVLATEVYTDINAIDAKGLFWGFLGAMAYTLSLFTSNRIGISIPTIQRSFWMMTGGFVVVIIAALPVLLTSFSWSVFMPWGLFLAVFGTVLPPLLMNRGMPITGMGIGSIIISIEIPVSVSMAYFFLGERIDYIQWSGVGLIILAIILLNYKKI